MDIEFVVGDAEALPFDDASFDGVLNVDSAHSYPNLDVFLLEVARVLRPGGAFMIADMFIEEHHDDVVGYLDSIGLTVEHDRDVTANVLLSRAQSVERQLAALGRFADHGGTAQLWGSEDSAVRRMLADGTLRYRTLTARRTGEPLPALTPAVVDRAIFTRSATIFTPFWVAD